LRWVKKDFDVRGNAGIDPLAPGFPGSISVLVEKADLKRPFGEIRSSEQQVQI
jgi:hypothetical protein